MFNNPWVRKPDFTRLKKFDYDEYWRFRGWEVAKGLKVREKLMLKLIPPRAAVLDMGCGNSRLPMALKERGCDVSVADISPLVLEGYKRHGISGHKVDLEKIDELKLKEKFDYIILSEVLEHLKNPEEVIAGLKKYTERFIITIPNSASYQFRLSLLFRGRFFTQWVHHPSEHLRYWSHIDFLDWLRAMGLDVERVVVAEGFTVRGMLPFLPRLWKNFLGFRMIYICKVHK